MIKKKQTNMVCMTMKLTVQITIEENIWTEDIQEVKEKNKI